MWCGSQAEAGENTRTESQAWPKESHNVDLGGWGQSWVGPWALSVGHPGSQAAHKQGIMPQELLFHWRLMTLPY